MPRKVLDIFLSSTSSDLQTYRSKVTEMIARLQQTTIRMESFGAKPQKPLDACRNEVQRCDALIVIVGHRYGWIPSKADGGDGAKSITWFEVQWALEARKPVYAFLVDPTGAWTGEREQDRLVTAESDKMIVEIGRSVQQLQKFRAFLETNTTRELFSSPEDLGGKVATSLHTWIVEQDYANAHAEYSKRASASSASVATHLRQSSAATELDFPYWQEQAHLLSGHHMIETAQGITIALLAGRANLEHPALSGATVRHVDAQWSDTTNPADDYTTALAGLLVGNGSATGYRGAAPGADLLVLRVLDENLQTQTAEILAALDAAVREGAKIVCMTLGGRKLSQIEKEVYRRAVDQGVIIVCAAGNEGDSTRIYPAAFEGCIAVAALGPHNRLAAFSSRGDWVATAAPGTDILVPVGKDRHEKWSGSSFACSIVTGAVALMLKSNPKLTPREVKHILQTTGSNVLEEGGKASASNLRALNVFDALNGARSTRKKPKAVRRKKLSSAGATVKRPPQMA